MGTNCAPLVADLFLFCYERDFMLSLHKNKDVNRIKAFNSTSRYLDDILNIDNPYFSTSYKDIYPKELQLNKANTSNTNTPFLDLDINISNEIIHTKIYDKRDDFNFEIVNFPFLDGDVPRAPSYGIYISQLVRYARASTHVIDFNERNLNLTKKLLQQGYRFDKLRKTFSKFFRRNLDLLSKYNTSMKSLMNNGITHPEFYSDVLRKLSKIKRQNQFCVNFNKLISKFLYRGYNKDVLRRTVGMVFDRCTVNHCPLLSSSHDDRT